MNSTDMKKETEELEENIQALLAKYEEKTQALVVEIKLSPRPYYGSFVKIIMYFE